MDHAAVWSRVEEAYARCADAEEFLLELLRIWTEHGLVEGEWSCTLREAV